MSFKWNTYAGGTFAAPDKHGYSARTNLGTYDIQPVSFSSGKHRGYRLHFINDKGKLAGGLYQEIGMFRSPNAAKSASIKHYNKHLK